MENASTTLDLTDEFKARNAPAAAAKLVNLPAEDLVRELMHLSPAFAQDVLDELPNDARERALSAAPRRRGAPVAAQRACTTANTVGRMMEPVVARIPDPQHTVGETIEALRELVKRALITYVYVVDDDERLLGIVTMRDLLFSERGRTLERGHAARTPFALHAADAGSRTR